MSDGSLFEDLMHEYEEEYQQERNRVSQEELDAGKVAAEEGALLPARPNRGSAPGIHPPEVRPANDSRQSRRMAAAEQEEQWRIVQKTRRTALANESVVAVSVHAQRQLDRGQEAMTELFYGVKRRPAMIEFMSRVTARCLSLAESGVMAVLESHPKRIGEDL